MPKIDDKTQDRISYGHTSDLSRMPTMWTNTYEGAVRFAKFDQPANRPYYIIESVEHFGVCGIVEKSGDTYLVSMPNDKLPSIYIKQKEDGDVE